MAQEVSPVPDRIPEGPRAPEFSTETPGSPEQAQEGAPASSHEQVGEAGSATAPAYQYQATPQDEATHQAIAPLPQDEQIETLKRMAFEEGVAKAAYHAQKLGDPYVIDELHDALVGDLRAHLIGEGKLTQL